MSGSILETFSAKGKTSQANFIAAHESAFWVRARRNRLLAEWVCDLTGEDHQAYLKLLLDADFARVETRRSESFLLQKIRNDLMGSGVFLTEEQLRQVYDDFDERAWRERSL